MTMIGDNIPRKRRELISLILYLKENPNDQSTGNHRIGRVSDRLLDRGRTH